MSKSVEKRLAVQRGDEIEPDLERAVHGGVQKLFWFDNGYGASVVKHSLSYGSEKGLWELAVLKGTSAKYSLTYDTPITDDVLGNLTWPEVQETLRQIKALEGDK